MIQASPTRQCIRLSSVSVCHSEGSVVKKFVAVATAIAAFGFVNSASAADMPTKAPVPMMVPMYNWAGWYVGGNVGYGWGANSDPGVTFVDGSAIGVAAYYAFGGNVMPNVRQKGVIGGL